MLTTILEINYYLGNYEKAIEYGLKDKEIRKEKQGEKHPDYANSLNNLAALYYEMGNYPAAEPLYLEAKSIFKEVLGEKHPDYATSLNNLAELYRVMSNYQKAEPLYNEAKDIRKEVLGEKHPYYATSLNNLAVLYKEMGNYQKAEPLYIEAMKFGKEILGEKHPDYAISLNNLAVLYMEMGNYQKAEPLYIESMKLRKEVLGEKHPDYTSSLNNLAVLYWQMGNYNKAEPLFIEAINIKKEVLGKKHPNYAISLSGLAVSYYNIGNYEKAEPLFIESMKLQKEVLGEKHPDYAISLNNLAVLYYNMGNYEKAEPLYIEAKEIWKEVLGEKHPNYARSLTNLATLYESMGNYTAAGPLYIEAKSIWKEVLGEKHPDYAISLNGLAVLYVNTGNSASTKEVTAENYEKAEPLYIEAKEIWKEVLGEKHPDYAIFLNNLALLYEKIGNYQKAEPLLIEGLNIMNHNVYQNFSFLSKKEKELYFITQAGTFADFYSFSLMYKTENPEITETVFNNVVKNKGLLLKSSTAMRTAILHSKDTALISQYEKWLTLKKEISKLYSTEISKRQKNPEELEQQANALEKELVRGSQVFSDFEKVQNLTWESVKNSLKSGEAAIEFIHFAEEKKKDTITYCALIVKSDSKEPEMIPLFEEKQLSELLSTDSKNDIERVDRIYGTRQSEADKLYKLIWKPVEKSLKGVKTIYYSPDGLLHKISFSVIAKDKNILLCDEYKLQQMSSTGKLIIPESGSFEKNFNVALLGGIQYSADTIKIKIWTDLPGTKTEAVKIEQIFAVNKTRTIYISGKAATEENFKQLFTPTPQNLKLETFTLSDVEILNFKPAILHIATHGFFYPDPEEKLRAIKDTIKRREAENLIAMRNTTGGYGFWNFYMNKNPLMRSGLALACANNVWNQRFVGEGEDGVLTAMEVTQLDMRKTQLVVMSACETGLGDIHGSEGVYGLQRAFKMAGVKYIIMSLWQVPDKETEEFMVTFYTKLLKQKDIRMAFNETQDEMREKYDPYYWGAFVLIE
ncbi:MAG: CHAT domain-containing protein [Bacteroidia bacterium]|nr:CHAT domain-containing protein [Bacteroidia bacterium]